MLEQGKWKKTGEDGYVGKRGKTHTNNMDEEKKEWEGPKPKRRKGSMRYKKKKKKKGKRKRKDSFEDFKEEVQWREGKENVYSVN